MLAEGHFEAVLEGDRRILLGVQLDVQRLQPAPIQDRQRDVPPDRAGIPSDPDLRDGVRRDGDGRALGAASGRGRRSRSAHPRLGMPSTPRRISGAWSVMEPHGRNGATRRPVRLRGGRRTRRCRLDRHAAGRPCARRGRRRSLRPSAQRASRRRAGPRGPRRRSWPACSRETWGGARRPGRGAPRAPRRRAADPLVRQAARHATGRRGRAGRAAGLSRCPAMRHPVTSRQIQPPRPLRRRLIEYRVRRSARSRGLRVTIDPRAGVLVSVPPPTRRGWAQPEARIEAFLREREAWVVRHLESLERDREAAAARGGARDGGLVPFRGELHHIRVVAAGSTVRKSTVEAVPGRTGRRPRFASGPGNAAGSIGCSRRGSARTPGTPSTRPSHATPRRSGFGR